uniref:Uncharacterized protein n=1 Tax=Ciona savignyi TaxID=51511 RepID=H2Z753_CIOSA
MFNSLQHGSGVLNGASGVRKLSLSNQMSGAPRLARSISTPAKHGSQYNGMDDNPFFKLHDSQNNLMALTDQNDGINLSSLESQLYDIIRSN